MEIYKTSEADRKRVVELIPEIDMIQDADLKEKTIIAWVKSWRESSFKDLSDVPAALDETKDKITQIDHLRAVTHIAIGIADSLAKILSFIKIDKDVLIAGAICHDLGKCFEYDPVNQEKWKADPNSEGKPAIRHSVYGVHLALSVGFPVEIAHIMGAHSMEGRFLQRSLPNTVINFADHVFWEVAWKAGFNKVMQYI